MVGKRRQTAAQKKATLKISNLAHVIMGMLSIVLNPSFFSYLLGGSLLWFGWLDLTVPLG
jgi:hypothetical protein